MNSEPVNSTSNQTPAVPLPQPNGSSPENMDRQHALDVIDSLTPRQRQADCAQPSVEVRAAHHVLEADPEGRRQLDIRRQLYAETPIDIEIVRVMRDVPVPVGARERLMQKLAAGAATSGPGTATDPPAAALKPASALKAPSALQPAAALQPAGAADTVPATSRPRSSKRRGWLVPGLVAAVLFLAVGVWQVRSSRPIPVALEEARLSAAADPGSLPALASDQIAPPLPAGSGWQRIEFGQNEAGAPDFRELRIGKNRAAVCRFRIVDRGRVRLTGHIVALRKNSVIDPPQASLLSLSSGVHYAGGIASVSWTEGDVVFLCYVRGGEESLKLLERALDIRLS